MTYILPTRDLDEIVDRSPAIWRALAGQRIFLTGGTGFLGRWVTETLLRANETIGLGAHLSVLSRNPNPLPYDSKLLTRIHGDLLSFTVPPFVFFDSIIHMAAVSSYPVEPQEMVDTIVDGTRRMLRLAVGRGSVKRFLYMSSGAVYGRGDTGTFESAHTSNPYADSKRMAELLCSISDVPCVIARGFSFLGPGMPLDGHFAVGNFIRDAIAGGPIKISSDGTPSRSYLYCGDLVTWLLKILVDGKVKQAYNVGGPACISIVNLAYRIAQKTRCEVVVEGGDAGPSKIADGCRAQEELGLTQYTSLDVGLERTIEYARAH